MQNIADTIFCISTGALLHREITIGNRNESEYVGTNTGSYLIFMVVKYGLILAEKKKTKRSEKNTWTKAK